MTLREWLTFCVMAVLWGALGHAGAHYMEVGFQSYRGQMTDRWFDQHVRQLLQ